MENYIIRIYRRGHSVPGKMTGLLESVEQELRTPFQSMSELAALLTSSDEKDQQNPGHS